MKTRRDRSGQWMPALGIALLATLLLVALGWAVVGKHRLDPHAQHVYKSTRLVLAEKLELTTPPPTCGIACADAPFSFEQVVPTQVPSSVSAPHRDHRHPPRAPPSV